MIAKEIMFCLADFIIQGGFLLYILIEEDDVDSKEIIDRIYIEQQLSPGTRTAMMNYIGNFSNAQMMLSFSVECVNGFNGSDCSMSKKH